MNNRQLTRLLNLIKKTGDRLIVADKDSDDIFVLLNLEDYEDLSNVKEDSLADDDFDSMPEINGEPSDYENSGSLNGRAEDDADDWHEADLSGASAGAADEINSDEVQSAEDLNSVKPAKARPFTKGVRPIPSLGDVLADDKYRKRQFDDTPRKNWVEEEDLSGVPEEEEKFYLEPVE